ncbi:uncharacterized protein MELLADRAFT_92095 [Melampsora larici-populina 98AG31]|uniref:CxC1-like cysteine cluster associated with KDZ transposases domain-containing protein n=1 Tax=Melampsora larici-populina (strain 98AG31 / pathotype 3-4-7) TaxID=747676 RepID=F4S1H2_MELLP|nr:uncharacterized protein MELLADRAFT_92095 [Melampsora larici-populina 98AG31]EGG01505.1 hypothetical protein MELLADRAFT_92095 [Melampsora larici-populina 98AG31]
MAGKRKAPSFKGVGKLPKNATDLQKLVHDRRKTELKETKRRLQSLLGQSSLSDGTFAPRNKNTGDNDLTLDDTHDDNFGPPTQEDSGGWMDIDEPIHGDDMVVKEEDPLVTLLNSSYAQARRLEQEKRWIRQYQLNLPIFLACRDRTANWCNPSEALRDAKPPCECRGKDRSIRLVDLLDVSSRTQRAINFCACQSDQGRLIQMGYMGASPVHPRTAFSLGLLRIHHILWKYCCVRTEPFALALDEWLDGFCPVITSKRTNQAREWRKPLSAAADAYRRLITAVRKRELILLKLNELDKLAANCPRCFGPPAPDAKTEAFEPDFICCCDGNFQHRRHLAASVPIPGLNPETPELFIKPEKVESMAELIQKTGPKSKKDHEYVVHPQA